MTIKIDNSLHASDREILATRTVNAPRERVFKLWIDPNHISQWWGPTGFTVTIHQMDVRPGGLWEFVMHGPDGVDYPNTIKFVEIVEPERLVYDHISGPQFQMTITFDAQGDQTNVTVSMVFETAQVRQCVDAERGATAGLHQTLERFAALAEHA